MCKTGIQLIFLAANSAGELIRAHGTAAIKTSPTSITHGRLTYIDSTISLPRQFRRC